jgi:predicted MPP superfamily phosphohydrolase
MTNILASIVDVKTEKLIINISNENELNVILNCNYFVLDEQHYYKIINKIYKNYNKRLLIFAEPNKNNYNNS